jgi:NaMN:DMB phosphoribosyltransferase
MLMAVHPSMLLWLAGGAAMIAAVTIIALLRRARPNDLGSVSTAWTTEHNSGGRGGDSSTR